MRHLLLFAIAALLLLSACHRTDRHTEALLRSADSLLTANPDSALALLQSLPASTKRLAKPACARYALLLARATNKCMNPLLPCDSLLDVALDYYGQNHPERATALLYKGRLEAEMAQSERAVDFFLEGLHLTEQFPEEVETKRHLLSSLGNEYLNARLYEKAGKTFQELQKYCSTDRDKAIALNRLGAYYSMVDKIDSTLTYQYQALEHAKKSNDSAMIALIALSISTEYSYKEANDTALHYAQMALQWLPVSESKSIYYNNIGGILYDKSENDSAEYYINKSLEDSLFLDLQEKSNILLTLSYIKEEQGKYQETAELLYQFIDIADSLYFTEQSTKIQQLIHQYDIKKKIYKEQRKNKQLLRNITGLFLFLCLTLIIVFQHRINKREKQRAINEQKLIQAQERYNNLRNSINESNRIIMLLQKKQSDISQEAEKYKSEIAERENAIQKLKTEKEELRVWLFKQSSIYKKIEKLSNQKVTNKKELTVLTNCEQKTLKEAVMELYADYISDTKLQYPLLTDDDYLYLCLEKIGLSKQTIALCFGNTDTHALAQKKYRIKGRMDEGK